VVLVNAEGQEIGTGLKYPVHRSGCLHRAFGGSCAAARCELRCEHA
jgi:isopentenyldiphosphate isomerase